MRPDRRTQNRAARQAFTLVEILVVLAIITVLISLTTAAYVRFIGSQKQSNTVLLLQKVSNALNHQWQAVVDQAKTETIPSGVLSWAGGDSERARVMWIKLRLKYEFPMNQSELTNPWGSTTNPGYVNPFVDATFPSPKLSYLRATNNGAALSGLTAPQQSAALLYLALTEKRRGQNFEPDKELSDNEVATDPNSGLKMIVDAWGTPISLFRWPTGTQDPVNGGQAQNGLLDPGDPRGKLADVNWVTASGGQYFTAFINVCHNLPTPPATGTPWPQSYALVPVIASAGPDKLFGLLPSMDLDSTNDPQAQQHAFDNLYSYDKRMGKGG